MKKTAVIVLISVIFAMTTLAIVRWPWRWLVTHGWQASTLADDFLNNLSPTINDEFIDYTIYTAHGCIVFATHKDNRAMVYCPNSAPANAPQIGDMLHIIGPWYEVQE
ncbi:hypothetical protein [Allochromatium vinosum]|uniref:hypothetical protein n=1 Tax=Allochromatium vinosum TaxID=1049 RepID=UPI0011D09135|nr:hypothetical protein [Allochromatium vinosum]